MEARYDLVKANGCSGKYIEEAHDTLRRISVDMGGGEYEFSRPTRKLPVYVAIILGPKLDRTSLEFDCTSADTQRAERRISEVRERVAKRLASKGFLLK